MDLVRQEVHALLHVGIGTGPEMRLHLYIEPAQALIVFIIHAAARVWVWSRCARPAGLLGA